MQLSVKLKVALANLASSIQTHLVTTESWKCKTSTQPSFLFILLNKLQFSFHITFLFLSSGPLILFPSAATVHSLLGQRSLLSGYRRCALGHICDTFGQPVAAVLAKSTVTIAFYVKSSFSSSNQVGLEMGVDEGQNKPLSREAVLEQSGSSRTAESSCGGQGPTGLLWSRRFWPHIGVEEAYQCLSQCGEVGEPCGLLCRVPWVLEKEKNYHDPLPGCDCETVKVLQAGALWRPHLKTTVLGEDDTSLCSLVEVVIFVK